MVKKEWEDDTFHDRVSDRRSLYFLLSDSISDRTLVLLFLCNSNIQCRHNIIHNSLQAAYTNKTNVPADLQSAGTEDYCADLLAIARRATFL